MKNFLKIFILLISVVLLFAMVSCGDDPEDSGSTEPSDITDSSADESSEDTSSSDKTGSDDESSDTQTSDSESTSTDPENQEDKNSDLGSGWSPNFKD